MTDLINKLGRALLLGSDDLYWLIRSAPHRYKVYQIPKRAPGQFRTIAQPAREVKALQYWVIDNVLSKFHVHESATAYREDVSIADNARPHADKRFLLKMDFKDFFPSLRASDFKLFLRKQKAPYDAVEIDVLCNILFWMPKRTRKLCLSIGAPSSPMLSNLLLNGFDCHVTQICKSVGVTYTRYADDLSFSSDDSQSLREVEKAVSLWCKANTTRDCASTKVKRCASRARIRGE